MHLKCILGADDDHAAEDPALLESNDSEPDDEMSKPPLTELQKLVNRLGTCERAAGSLVFAMRDVFASANTCVGLITEPWAICQQSFHWATPDLHNDRVSGQCFGLGCCRIRERPQQAPFSILAAIIQASIPCFTQSGIATIRTRLPLPCRSAT